MIVRPLSTVEHSRLRSCIAHSTVDSGLTITHCRWSCCDGKCIVIMAGRLKQTELNLVMLFSQLYLPLKADNTVKHTVWTEHRQT